MFEKEYGEGIGIKVCGDMDIDEQFEYRYYPIFQRIRCDILCGCQCGTKDRPEAYVGICEDTKVGINLVFYLQKCMMEYLREKALGGRSIKYSSVTLSGLCNEGTILLPVRKSKEQEREQQEDVHNRMLLKSAARIR